MYPVPCRQLAVRDVFILPSRINTERIKCAIIDWHQDFGYYHQANGVPEA